MRVVSVVEAIQMTPGEHIPAFKGRLKKLGKYSSGDNEHGHWAFQNGTVTDGNGEIKVKFKNREALPPAWEGRAFYIESTPGTKQPFLGIVRELDEYKGVQKPCITVDERAIMSDWQGGEAATQQAQPAARQPAAHQPAPNVAPASPFVPQATNQPPPAQSSAPAARPPAPKPGSPEDHKECARRARVRLGKAANAMLIAFDAANHVGVEVMKKHQIGLGITEVEKIAVSFYITLDREGMVDGLPSGPLETPATPAN